MILKDYSLIVINNSSGKDSLSSLLHLNYLAEKQNYPKSQIVVSHQIIKEEWGGTIELVKQQADLFGFSIEYSRRRTKEGVEESLLDYAVRRGKWPSNAQRWCTSDFKRGPGARVVTKLTGKDEHNVLYVFGFRIEESPSRAKKLVLEPNKRLTTRKRIVTDYLPIHTWSTKEVWNKIRYHDLPYHPAYDLGMPRLSCCFCIFSPFDALVVAGKANPDMLNSYIEAEEKMGHTFKDGFSIAEVQTAIENGYEPKKIENWRM